jgi:hypothetical protein
MIRLSILGGIEVSARRCGLHVETAKPFGWNVFVQPKFASDEPFFGHVETC